MKRQHIAHKTIAAGLGLVMALGALAPAAAIAESTGTTNLYVQAPDEGITTPEGAADANIKVVLPVAINYVANGDGSLTGPSDDTVKIKNNTELGAVHVSKIQVQPEQGVTIVASAEQATENDSVYLKMRPGTKETRSMSEFLSAKAPTAGDWDVAQQGELSINGLTGKIGGFDKLDPSSKEKIAAIHWTVAPGTAAQAAETANTLTIHLVNATNSLEDLSVDKSEPSGTLPSGYVWKTADNTEVADVAAAVSVAGDSGELTLFGTAVA
ncbi:MAG: hypothetical protein Q4B54_07035 [Coriobacteriales bacterium]|nr:hypothetical protein [Coriobacteriales bacterium]